MSTTGTVAIVYRRSGAATPAGAVAVLTGRTTVPAGAPSPSQSTKLENVPMSTGPSLVMHFW